MKLYLDDIRRPPEGWTLARNVAEAQRLITGSQEPITHMSLDHDLGMQFCRSCAFRDMEEPCFNDNGEQDCDCTCHVPEPTGTDLLRWIHEKNLWPPNRPLVHSANPVGAKHMENFINDHGPYGGK